MTFPRNFPGRVHARRASAIERMQTSRALTFEQWTASAFVDTGLESQKRFEQRNKNIDRTLAHTIEVHAADIGAIGRRTKKVQANSGRKQTRA